MGFIQAEQMFTINFFNAPSVAGWNLLVILWIVLVVAWFGFYFYNLQYGAEQVNFAKITWWLLCLAWLPLAISSGLSFTHYFLRNIGQIGRSVAVKQEARLCDIDDNQNFRGILCRLYPVINEVKNRVPAGSKLFYSSFGLIQPFLNFRLWDDYGPSVDCRQADGLLLYMTEQKIVYDESGHVRWTKKTQAGDEVIDCGSFTAPYILADSVFLLIRSTPQ